MFTVEIKINGSLIGHIYGLNEGEEGDASKYRYEYYEPETREVRNGNILHKRSDGIRVLVANILKDAKPNAPRPKIKTQKISSEDAKIIELFKKVKLADGEYNGFTHSDAEFIGG